MVVTDSELIKRIKYGDQDALMDFYLKHTDLLFTFIFHYLKQDRDAASDIWQETWIVFIDKIDKFNAESTPFTWLCSIARNKIADYYRVNSKQQVLLSFQKTAFDIDTEMLEEELIDEGTKSTVLAVLSILPKNYRYILEAKYCSNKSIDEISLSMGKTYKAVESMLSRAREAFRHEFKKYNSDKNEG